jgi:hypothetical protein
MMMVMTVLVVVMTGFMVMLMPVVFATVGRDCQLTVEIRCHELFHGRVANAGANGDAMMRKIGQRAFPDAASDDYRDTLFAQPPWERAGLMFGCRQ